MIKLENDILTDEEEPLEMYSEIKNDTTNAISVGDPNRSKSPERKQVTNNSSNFIGG